MMSTKSASSGPFRRHMAARLGLLAWTMSKATVLTTKTTLWMRPAALQHPDIVLQ